MVRRLGAVCADQPGRPGARFHNRTGEDACPERSDGNADAHLKRHGPPSEAVVVAVTNGRLDDSTELAEVFGTWERIF